MQKPPTQPIYTLNKGAIAKNRRSLHTRKHRKLQKITNLLFHQVKTRCTINNYHRHLNTLMKRVILITGTPCVGKTTTAKQLATKLGAHYINLTEYAKMHGLTLGEDKKRQTTIINEKAMHQKLAETINATDNANIIIDGHYAAAVTPSSLVTHVFVLRRNPKELKKIMQKNNYPESKHNENLAAEILDTCLIEALQTQKDKVCELNVTGKSAQETVREILAVADGKKKCHSGIVDWLGMLEREGLIGDYLKI